MRWIYVIVLDGEKSKKTHSDKKFKNNFEEASYAKRKDSAVLAANMPGPRYVI